MSKLKNQLGKNSTNSHKPSSTDYFFRKTVEIEPSDKAKGGQRGHIGNTLRMVENPDQIIIHEPTRCTCGENLVSIAKQMEHKRQLFDLLIIKFNVVEHQITSCDCPRCGRVVVITHNNLNKLVKLGNMGIFFEFKASINYQRNI